MKKLETKNEMIYSISKYRISKGAHPPSRFALFLFISKAGQW